MPGDINVHHLESINGGIAQGETGREVGGRLAQVGNLLVSLEDLLIQSTGLSRVSFATVDVNGSLLLHHGRMKAAKLA